MYSHHSNGSTTLPRDFRYHHEEGPTTPEPLSNEEPRQPSPPRQRLRVRRRVASSLSAPTEHFLASVAAADIPIPTIEVAHDQEDLAMADRDETENVAPGLLAPRRFFSPPKTPIPQLSTEDLPSQRPLWRMESPATDEEYFVRERSMSNASDYSDDSFYSGGRRSRPSEDGSCTSPESDTADPFKFPMLDGKGKSIDYFEEPTLKSIVLNKNLRSKTRKDAHWTKAQSTHLWSTYLVYLSDATVTPFRLGASSIPPEGVCHRVAREARRSWKGGKTPPARRTPRLRATPVEADKSGSNTPTAEASHVYAAWPHSNSATRNHLRALCRKQSDTSSVSRHRHLQSRSPTPFTKSNTFSRPREPERISTFDTLDISVSLTASTAETMQPDGPLAKLTRDSSAETIMSSFPPLELKPSAFSNSSGLDLSIESRNRRLGSPFSHTYGPSSSKFNERRPSPPRHAISGPQLGSPLRFDHPRSLNGTQKRRAQHDLEEELSPNGAIVRPSILNEQLFGTPNQRRVRTRGFSLGDEALRGRDYSAFQLPAFALPPRMEIPPPRPAPSLLPSATFDPPARLGSPFMESGPSTFPRRLFPDPQATIKRSTFATMHQTRRSIESFDFGPGPSLQSRLEQLDTKLKQIREREAAAKQAFHQ